jgi:ubiquinone/menaquinone biosynthesis C-methylase UbiE
MADFDASNYRKIEREAYSATAGNYEKYGSRNFEAYAGPLLKAAGLTPGEDVLDVACGPGIPSLMAAPLVLPGRMLTGLDLAPGMVELAREKARSRGIHNASFGEGDAENLPFPDGSFDVVLCNHGLVHTTDREKALREMHRVLKRNGRLALSVWSTPDRACVIGIVAGAIREIWPSAVVPGAPMWFDLGPEGILEKILGETGFSDIRIERFTISMEAASGTEYWEAVVGISGRLQMLLKNIPEDAAKRIESGVMSAAENFRSGDIIKIPCEEIIATARA